MIKLLYLMFIASFALAACNGEKATGTPVSVKLEVSDPARQLEAEMGNEFKIVIESNPTTGYQWKLVRDLDPNVVEFVSNEYRGDEPVMPGSGGVDIWVFKAVGAGKATITLGHYPPSNNPVEPEQTVTFTVTVKK